MGFFWSDWSFQIVRSIYDIIINVMTSPVFKLYCLNSWKGFGYYSRFNETIDKTLLISKKKHLKDESMMFWCISVSEICTAQRMMLSIKDFFNKCEQIGSFLRIWSHLLKKFLMENFIFCAVMTFLLSVKYWFHSHTQILNQMFRTL